MKSVLSGNHAIARGAYEAGVAVVSSYPGTPSTEITECISKYDEIYSEWATNEAVAMEVALGASLAGVRSLVAFKHVGLNVAADPLMTSAYTGITGGLVVVVADDPNIYSSQNEQDSRHYARLAKLPMLEPSDSAEAYKFVKRAYEISEKYATPVFVRSVTRVSHSLSVVETATRQETAAISYTKNSAKWVMTPVNARVRHQVLEERITALVSEAEALAEEFINSTEIGIVTSGVPFQYVREALPDVSVLKLGMVMPLPIAKIAEFAKKVKKLYIVEELDPIIETEVRAAGIKVESLNRSPIGELSVEAVERLFGISREMNRPLNEPIPVRLPNMCAGCSHRGIFYAASRMKLMVSGDIGCYTLGYMPPLSANDSTVCMGASVSMAHGFDKANGENAKHSIGVIGDSTFLHSGVNGLINSVFNGGRSTIVILDNRITGMTGHQPNAASGRNIKGQPAHKLDIEALCRAVGVQHIQIVDPFDIDACMNALKEALAKEEVSVIITNRPCIFVDTEVATRKPYHTTADCSGCKACLKIGCPAISWDATKKAAVIDAIQCTGCALCHKVCRFSAIVKD